MFCFWIVLFFIRSFVSCFSISCNLFVNLFFANFPQGSGDSSKNGARMLESRTQIMFFESAIQNPFAITKRAVNSPLKHFSRVVQTLLDRLKLVRKSL
jgi:hypothetical protein